MKEVLAIVCLVTLASVILAGSDPHVPKERKHRLDPTLVNPEEVIENLTGKREGDILGAYPRPGKDGLIGRKFRWPKGRVPYEFQVFPPAGKALVKRAMDSLTKISNGCVTFFPRTNETDYVVIKSLTHNCYSKIGKHGGEQEINLPQRCFNNRGSTMHLLLQTLGFYHAHKHPDKLLYVDIMWNNIMNGQVAGFFNFSREDVPDIEESYDYGSIMHFSSYALTKNDKKTIVPKDPKAVIGQREKLSEQDVKILRKLYKC